MKASHAFGVSAWVRLLMLGFLLVGLDNHAYGQGTVYFITSVLGESAKVTEHRCFPGAGLPLGYTAAGVESGTHFLAQLYAGAGLVADSSLLVPVGQPVNFRGGSYGSGYVQQTGTTTLGWPVDEMVTIPSLPILGGPATIQMRVWWAGPSGNTYASWEKAMSIGWYMESQMRLGFSGLLHLPATGNPMAQPPGTPVFLTGFQGFQLMYPMTCPDPPPPPPPPEILSQPSDQSVIQGSSASFSVLLNYEPAGYRWRKDGEYIAGARYRTYSITNVSLADAGKYDVEACTYVCVTSSVAVLQVLPFGAPSIRVNNRLAVGTVQAVNPATVSFEGGFSGGSCFYTSDGSTPTINSTPYVGPFQLTIDATIRAMCRSADLSQTSEAPAVQVQIVMIPPYLLQVAVSGDGSVSLNPPGPSYASNTVVTLTAQPSANWVFTHWTGDLSGSANPAQLTMNAPRSVTAFFLPSPPRPTLGLYSGITIAGTPGSSYGIQYSTDLTDTNAWTTITNLILNQPVETWVDTNVDVHAPGNLKRYYRVIAP